MKPIVCRKCGETYYRENGYDKCPKCGASRPHRRLSPALVDDLILDVREADAAGKSYGYWRIGLMLEKQKAREKMQAERERRRKEKDAEEASEQ